MKKRVTTKGAEGFFNDEERDFLKFAMEDLLKSKVLYRGDHWETGGLRIEVKPCAIGRKTVRPKTDDVMFNIYRLVATKEVKVK